MSKLPTTPSITLDFPAGKTVWAKFTSSLMRVLTDMTSAVNRKPGLVGIDFFDRSALVAITGAWATLTYDNTIRDDMSAYSGGVFTVPAGVAAISIYAQGEFTWSGGGGTDYGIRLLATGAAHSPAHATEATRTAQIYGSAFVALMPVSQGDTFAVQVFSSGGSPQILSSAYTFLLVHSWGVLV